MLRRALQPVRDTDGSLAKLDVLRNSLLETPIVDSHEDRSNLTQIEKLKDRLRKRRQAKAENLTAVRDA